MSTKIHNDGGPAFPIAFDAVKNGMTLHQWFAGMAMQGLYATGIKDDLNEATIADCALNMADEMIAAYEKRDRK